MNLVNYGATPIPALEDIAVRLMDEIKEGPADFIPGFLPRQGACIIAGETNIGKSSLALETCNSLITGGLLWGEVQPTGRAKKILYILGEHVNETIQRLARYMQLPFSPEVYLLGPEAIGYDRWLVSNGRPNTYAIDKFKKWAEGMDLIVWDPLGSFVCGSGDTENDNIGMRLVIDSMSLVAQTVGAASMVLAHMGKPQMDQYGKEHSRKSYAIRGASAIEDAATNIFYLTKASGESDAAQQAADGQIYDLTCRKYKGAAPDKYRLLRDPSKLTHTLLGNRPFVEVRKIAMEGDVSRMMFKLGIDRTKAIQIVAAWRGVDERTVRHALGMA